MLKGVVNELTNLKSTAAGNCISSSACGNIATIADGKLCIVCAVSSDSVVTKEVSLFLENGCKYEIATDAFTNIQFNAEGTMLALWNNRQQFAVVDLSNCMNKLLMSNSSNEEQCSGIDAPIYLLSSKSCTLLSSSRKDGAPAVGILKVQWHPLFSSDVVILLDSNYLLVFHTGAMGDDRLQEPSSSGAAPAPLFEVLPLDTTDPIVSFAFGSTGRVASGTAGNDWQCLCLYLLSNSSMINSTVYVLCPFITICPLSTSGAVNPSGSGAVERFLNPACLRQWVDDFGASPGLFQVVSSKHDLQLYLQKIRRFIGFLQQSATGSDGQECFLPAVQGPLKLSGSTGSDASTRSVPSDIAVLDADVFAPTGTESQLDGAGEFNVLPPVLVVSFGNSDVEVYLQARDVYPVFRTADGDSEQPDSDSRSSDSSSDDDDDIVLVINSNRKTSSQSHALAIVPKPTPRLFAAPELIFVDSLMVLSLVCGNSGSTSPGSWKIITDPVLPFCFYLTNFVEGKSFLLCLHWWKHYLAGSNSDNTPSASSVRAIANSAACDSQSLEACIAANPMYCIPVLSCASQGLAGMACLSNMYIGHKMIYKLEGDMAASVVDNGVVMCVNITIHMKLLELQSSLSSSKELFKSLRDMESQVASGSKGTSSAFEEITLNCLIGIRKALLDVPTPGKLKLKPKESSAVYSNCLSDATAYLEEHILIPMEELSQRLKYRIELLKQMYTTQVDILHGKQDTAAGAAANDDYIAKLTTILNKPTKTKADMSELTSFGVVKLLHAVQTRQDQLMQRVADATSMYRIQKELVENAIAQSLYIHSQQIQPEERAFQKKVHEWRQYATTLDRSIANLEKQMDVLRSTEASSSDCFSVAPSTGSTPVKTQQQWLTDRTNASALASGMKSPLAGSGMSPMAGGSGAKAPNTTITGAATWFKRNRASRSGVSTPVTGNHRGGVGAGSTPAHSATTPVHSLLSSMTLNDGARHRTGATAEKMNGAVSDAIYGANGRRTTGATMASLLSPSSAMGTGAATTTSGKVPVQADSFASPEKVTVTTAATTTARRDSKTIISTLFNSPLPVRQSNFSPAPAKSGAIVLAGTVNGGVSAGSGGPLSSVQYSVRDRDYMKELLVAQAKSLRECNNRIKSLDKTISFWAQKSEQDK